MKAEQRRLVRDKLVCVVGHFWILGYGKQFRIVNTNNGVFNKKRFRAFGAAGNYAEQLMYWHNVNRSALGKRRTAKLNKKVVAKYHKTKVQPKDWKTGVNGPN